MPKKNVIILIRFNSFNIISRWDIQRIREQNHVEKLKQKLNKQQQQQNLQTTTQSSDESPVRSFFPSIDDLEEILIDEELPVLAFGLEIPLFENW